VSEIEVTPQGGGAFLVTVSGPPRTTHRVTIPTGMLEELGGATPEAVVRESFVFLLEREPNTSILAEFSLDEIERYFPQYRQELPRRLA
jgi:hypothetical protein